jgi:plasmid maintenance system antidote protein VapI
MKTTVNQRVMQIIRYYNLSVFKFAKSIETAQPTVKSIIDDKTKPSYDTIYKILKKYPINASWLIMEEGDMLKRYKGNTIAVNNENMEETIKLMKYKLTEIENLIASEKKQEYGK